MLQNQIISYARTAVMLGVGYLLTWVAAHFHIVISEHTRTLAASLVAVVIAFVYYVIVRALESRWPKLGVLLGVPAKPNYSTLKAALGTVTFDPADQPSTPATPERGVVTTTSSAAAATPPQTGA